MININKDFVVHTIQENAYFVTYSMLEHENIMKRGYKIHATEWGWVSNENHWVKSCSKCQNWQFLQLTCIKTGSHSYTCYWLQISHLSPKEYIGK